MFAMILVAVVALTLCVLMMTYCLRRRKTVVSSSSSRLNGVLTKGKKRPNANGGVVVKRYLKNFGKSLNF